MVALNGPTTPVTIPLELATVAIVGALLLQTPPDTASLNVISCPAHTVVAPVIADSVEITVTTAQVVQPDAGT